MANSTTTLTEKINSFNHYYMMSESNATYNKGSKEEEELKTALNRCSYAELKSIYDGLSDFAKEALFVKRIAEYLEENKPEPTPEAPKSIRSRAMTLAHAMLKDGSTDDFGLAQKMAWRRIKLLDALHSGIAYFSFVKANKEHREAIGTLLSSNINYRFKGYSRKDKLRLVKFYDVEKREFRSVRLDRFISFSNKAA